VTTNRRSALRAIGRAFDQFSAPPFGADALTANLANFVDRDPAPFLAQQRVRVALVALLALIVVGAAILYGQFAHATAERSKAAAIEEESRAFCTSLGLAPPAETYTRCLDGLISIRQRHEERLNAEAMRVL
jgi:hypothetical protein